jgi:hypothetical protein
MDDTQQQAAHLLIHSIASHDSSTPYAMREMEVEAMIAEMQRLGAVRLSKVEDAPDDGNLHIDIDITNLLTPAATSWGGAWRPRSTATPLRCSTVTRLHVRSAPDRPDCLLGLSGCGAQADADRDGRGADRRCGAREGDGVDWIYSA